MLSAPTEGGTQVKDWNTKPIGPGGSKRQPPVGQATSYRSSC